MYYLAYGSNLHPLRLVDRVPGSRLVGTTQLEGYRLTFHKRSVDGSAKCNLLFTGASDDVAYGAVYFVPENEVQALDEAEGLNIGYYKQQLVVTVDGESLGTFTYIASRTHLVSDLEPYHWYKGLVLAGARKLRFPAHYIERIDSVPFRQDNNPERRVENENLLVQLEG
jgi:gamma-glutamylcyclotransferase